MIVLQNVTKYFKVKDSKKYILNNVSLKLPEHKNIGILGINGAGKSTLLRMLGGIDFPNSGKILSDKTFSWPMGLAGGFQGSMTGRQNVRFVARIFGTDESEIKRIIEFVKEFSELGDYFDMPIKTYSSGMKSRLSFGLSLAFDFDYLLIDETLSVGDARFKRKSKEALMQKIERSNVLMVSHSMKDLADICDAGLVIHKGDLYYFDDIKDAIALYGEINKNNEVKIKPAYKYFGAREKVKSYVSYNLGKALVHCFKTFSFLCPLVYPFFALVALMNREKIDIPLSKYEDRDEGEVLKKSREYRLGMEIIKLFKNGSVIRRITLPFALFHIYRQQTKEI